MRHGDLSNVLPVVIGFRCEDSLLVPKETNKVRELVSNIFPSTREYVLNDKYTSVMDRVYRRTEYCVDIIIQKENYTDKIKSLLDDLPFNRIVTIEKDTQISSRIQVGDISYYVDENPSRREVVSSKYSFDISSIAEMVRKGQQ
jgi:hypothetical protein